MFAGLFAKPDARLSALEAARKLYVAQINGYAGDTQAAVIAAERHVWDRVLAAFQIIPARGFQANVARINDLMDTCHRMSDRFDYVGLAMPTLIHNSNFAPEDMAALEQHLSETTPQGKAARKSAPATGKADHRTPAYAA